MDWKRFFDALGMNGTRWQWRMMRWERNIKGMLRGQTPGQNQIQASRTILLVNLVLFSLMVLKGAVAGLGMQPLMRPDPYLLIHMGAQYWPLVLAEGEWWRCLSYAFTHGGLIHLAFNMVVLYQIGPVLEWEIGRARFMVLYTLTALTATLAGYFWHPMAPVVGASGSLFGLIGFSVAYFHRMGDPVSMQRRNFMFQWAVFAFLFGLVVGADNAGHLGGAVGGALLGLILPIRGRLLRSTNSIFNLLALFSTGAIVVSLILLVISWFQVRGGV